MHFHGIQSSNTFLCSIPSVPLPKKNTDLESLADEQRLHAVVLGQAVVDDLADGVVERRALQRVIMAAGRDQCLGGAPAGAVYQPQGHLAALALQPALVLHALLGHALLGPVLHFRDEEVAPVLVRLELLRTGKIQIFQ